MLRFQLYCGCLPLPPAASASAGCLVLDASISAPLRLPPVVCRCLSLLLPPPVADALISAPLRLPPDNRASRGPREARPPRRLLDPFQYSFPVAGNRGGRSKRGPRGASLILFNFSFAITRHRGGRAKRGPRGTSLIILIYFPFQ